jgi:hypothetical protein
MFYESEWKRKGNVRVSLSRMMITLSMAAPWWRRNCSNWSILAMVLLNKKSDTSGSVRDLSIPRNMIVLFGFPASKASSGLYRCERDPVGPCEVCSGTICGSRSLFGGDRGVGE